MGNWTTVHISGTCSADEVPALRGAINIGEDWEKFHCLCNTGGLCGLGDWAGESISVVGNLAERGYNADDVAERLRGLLAVAPSLNLKVHVGGDYESAECVATVVCADGEVKKKPPEIEQIPSIPDGQIQGNLMKALMGF